MTLLGKHLTHAEIAADLVLSVRTVESHVASLRRKLRIAGHRDLVRYAAARQRGPALDVALTSFVGRARERGELAETVRHARMVSVVGPGGAGKTRLARVVAEDMSDGEFPDGIWFVDLVPVSDGAGLASAVAAECGLDELPGLTLSAAIVRGLSQSAALLVSDNCEHVVEQVAVLVDLVVAHCPRLRVLVTSRARLVLPFERVYPLGGLALDGDAAALLIDRAVAAGWPTPSGGQRDRIDAICARLDGLALAVELAAVRLPSLGLDGVERGLANQGALLVGGPRAAARHRSMAATIDWSFRLLDDTERDVLCRVSVFASGLDADAAAAVAGFDPLVPDDVPNALARLVDQSMMRAPTGGRWRVLEPVRQFALAQMEVEDRLAFARHFDWARARAQSLVLASATGRRDWYSALDDIADELRSAIRWAEQDPGRRDDAARAAHTLGVLLFRSGRLREAQRRFEQAAALTGDRVQAAGYSPMRPAWPSAGCSARTPYGSNSPRARQAATVTTCPASWLRRPAASNSSSDSSACSPARRPVRTSCSRTCEPSTIRAHSAQLPRSRSAAPIRTTRRSSSRHCAPPNWHAATAICLVKAPRSMSPPDR